MKNKISALFSLLIGIGYFCLFAYGIEYDRDLMTWFWLLFSQIWFMTSLRFWILHDKEN
jgi:formate hydrogenlyase subunit 3/multisubunit Na+/H+ antiporter MnhD subunit